MSAIGGIADFKCEEVDFNSMNKMRLSMSLRGRDGSNAFLCGGVGMFYNHAGELKKDEERQPYICERGGNIHAFCIDGEGFYANAIGEKYMLHGTDFLGLIDGAFALALYDAERDMLLLARDRRGRKPLFYRRYKNKIFFASEIKGILDGTGDAPAIDSHALGEHLLSPMGIYRGTDIYTDISRVLPGECVIFTSVGMSRFFYRERRDVPLLKAVSSQKRQKRDKPLSTYESFKLDYLEEYLCNALIAFDYPQFDMYMPSFMELLDRANMSGAASVCFEDGIRRKNTAYAYEREDRIGAFFGVSSIGVLPRVQPRLELECLQSAEDRLKERLFSMNGLELSLLRTVLGEYRLAAVLRMLGQKAKKAEDTERRLRILGMLCQCVEWMQARELILQNRTGEESNYSALSTI